MDYDVLKTSIAGAYKNYKVNDEKFNESMTSFYREGKQNPSVAKIMLKDHIAKGQQAAGKMLAEVAALPDNSIMDMVLCDGRTSLYGLSLHTAMKSIEADEMYKATQNYNNASVSQFRKEFEDSFNSKYPKTGELRNKIIEANRISMDKVTPKASWQNKINFIKTAEEYSKLYPKTFYTRYLLVTNEHIKEHEITKRVSGWFKRFYYKQFIKNGFCFKK